MGKLELHARGPLEELQGYTHFWSTCLRNRDTSFRVRAMLATELPTLPSEVATEVRSHFVDLSN